MVAVRALIRTSLALGFVCTIGAPSTAGAQEFGGGPPPYTPAAGAKDLKSVLFNWTWHMGMLRGIDEHELMASLEYQASGTVQVNGQPCTLMKYRVSTNYQTPGQRIQYACTRSGQTHSAIEVVSGPYAWNEDIAGAELIAGQGKATPMPNAVAERLIRFWAGPQGAPKAALQGTKEPDPGQLTEGGDKIGATSVAWEGGKPVVTFPIPGVAGATAVATLDDKFMAERVVVKQGSTTTEFTYADYQDWNNPLNKVEALYAGKVVERRNGTVVRDLTTTETETGNVYVVVPVPASVKAAIKVATPPPPVLTLARAEPPAQSAQPTPRTANGKPDLTGNWISARNELALREPPLRSDAGGRLQRSLESNDRFRVGSPVALRPESPAVQARELGQSSAARHVDEQGRPGDDLPAARDSAAWRASPDRPIGERRYLLLWPVCRRWRWARGISHRPDRRPQA